MALSSPPQYGIDPAKFWADPYPDLAEMRALGPLVWVPELSATLICRRDDIFAWEKQIETFSSEQPGGLMTVLMGENMMRKDGAPHQLERKQSFPSFSPRTARDVWMAQFASDTDQVLAGLESRETIDLVRDYAMPVSGHALRNITGLLCLTAEEMDAVSQGMIDGIANYGGDPEVEARCHAATAKIDAAIDEMRGGGAGEMSMLTVLDGAGQADESVRANIKLAISGGQNEPRDAIAGAVWALLMHPEERAKVESGDVSWQDVFEEYARWISPIGMSPRRMARPFEHEGVRVEAETRAFFMFSSGNRDERVFSRPEVFDVSRDTSKAISFGAGPHFCAGAGVSRVLIGGIALPKLFAAYPEIALDGEAPFGGWAFRGPLKMPVRLGSRAR